MAVVVDASLGEKALSAQEWLSQSSAIQVVVSSSLANKATSEAEEMERANDGILLRSRNSVSSRHGSVDVELQPWEEGGGVPPLTSTSSPLIKRKSSKSSSNKHRGHGIRGVTSTSSPPIDSTSSESSICEELEDGIPLLTSTCSPLIKSKSSKSSSNQDSLPGLVVAPDGVTLVKDRRKCKPRGILTVGLEMSSFDSSDDSKEEEVALPIPSPSVATVEWVDESWTQILSPPESHDDELHLSCSSINSKSRIVPPFDFPVDRTTELGVKEPLTDIKGAELLRLTCFPSVQELCDVRETGAGCPADLFFAGSGVSSRPESADEILMSVRDRPASTSSREQHCSLGLHQLTSPREETASCELGDHLSETQSLDGQLRLDLERQEDVGCAPHIVVSERSCDCSSDTIPREHSGTSPSTVVKDEIILGNHEDGSLGIEVVGPSANCPVPLEPFDYISNTISPEQSESTSLAEGKEEDSLVRPERESRATETVCPSSSILFAGSPLDEPPQGEGAGDADVPLGSFSDLAYARDVHIVKHSCGEAGELHQSEHSQRLSPKMLVAETLFQLAAENLRKTRTEVQRLNSSGGKRSGSEVVSSLSSSIGTYTCGENAATTEAAPFVLLSSMGSRHVTSRPDQAKVDFAHSRKRITLTQESEFSREVQTVKAVVQIMHGDEQDDEGRALRAATVAGQYTDQSSLALSRNAQRQYRHLRSGYNNVSSLRTATRHRFASRRKRVGLGCFLAAAAAFGFVAISLATGSCHLCYASSHAHHHIRPT